MPQKLTDAEKKARNAAQVPDCCPAHSGNGREEIAETEQALTDMRHVLSLALTQIRKRGLMIKTVVLDSHGQPVKTEKVNPALKVQKDALTSVRSLKRYLVLLREEENLAAEKQNESEDNEWKDFE